MSDVYLQVDLDATELVEPLSCAMALTTAEAGWGLIKLWKWCWREKRDVVSPTQLYGFFCSTPEARLRTNITMVTESLIEFSFLEAIEGEANVWRVKGVASRILRVNKALTAARRKGGLASKTNLKQYQEKPTDKPPKKPKPLQPDLIPTEPRAKKERALSEWQQAWEVMQGLAEDYADEHGVSYEREELAPARVNAVLKRACESLGVDADQLVEIWQEQWLPNEWAQTRDPVYGLGIFLSEKVLPGHHRKWEKDAAELAEYDRQVAAGENPRDPGFS